MDSALIFQGQCIDADLRLNRPASKKAPTGMNAATISRMASEFIRNRPLAHTSIALAAIQ